MGEKFHLSWESASNKREKSLEEIDQNQPTIANVRESLVSLANYTDCQTVLQARRKGREVCASGNNRELSKMPILDRPGPQPEVGSIFTSTR